MIELWGESLKGASLVAQMIKNPPANAEASSSIPGLGRSPGEGNGYPLQYSCLANPMERRAWRGTAHGITDAFHFWKVQTAAKSSLGLCPHPPVGLILSVWAVSGCKSPLHKVWWICFVLLCCCPQVMEVQSSGGKESKASLWLRSWASDYEETAILETAVMPGGHLSLVWSSLKSLWHPCASACPPS